MFHAMKAAADKLGFTLHPSDPGYFEMYSTVSLTGTVDGVFVVIERLAALSQLHTRAMIDATIPTKFALTREGLLDKLGSLVGIEDAKIGDSAFDAAFHVKTKDSVALARLLSADVRKQLDALRTSGASFLVTDQFVQIDRSYMIGTFWDAEQASQDVASAVALAKAFSAAARGA